MNSVLPSIYAVIAVASHSSGERKFGHSRRSSGIGNM